MKITQGRLVNTVLVLCTVLFVGQFAAAKQFGRSVTYLTYGHQPIEVVLGDFNRDGTLDIATADIDGYFVSVLLGNGDGTFQSAVAYPAGPSWPTAIGVGDFNNDGKLDLVVANSGPHEFMISVLTGNGDGTFQAPVSYPAGLSPLALAVADLDQDGWLDVAVVNNASRGSLEPVDVMLNRAHGTFESAPYPAGDRLNSVAVGDLNGDGIPDLVVGSYTSSASVLMGQGGGTFGKPTQVRIGYLNAFVTLADFNNDGKLDLAASLGTGKVAIALGNGDGTFQSSLMHAVAPALQGVGVGDFNQDGLPDIAVVAKNTTYGAYGTVSVLLGNGDGTFHSDAQYSANHGSVGIAVGDLNGDGFPDLVVANSYSPLSVSVLLNNGSQLVRRRASVAP